MSHELTPEQQQELHGLRKALAEEFTVNETNPSRKAAKTDIEELKGDMLDALQRTLKHGTIDQASKVAMWGYGKLLEEGKAGNDPIRSLIEGMPAPANDPMPEPTDEAIKKAVDVPDSIIAPADPTQHD